MTTPTGDFQPMNANFGLLPPLAQKIKGKKSERNEALSAHALATLRDETEPITVAARRLLDGFAAEDAVYIVTDVMGGSVNNEMLTLLPEYPAVHLICGMNASLVLTLASNDEALTQDELAECIADAKAQIIDCNLLLKKAAQDEEDDL